MHQVAPLSRAVLSEPSKATALESSATIDQEKGTQ